MAEIYLARQAGIEGFEKLLVLKRILPHLAENEEFVEMFLHEARVAVRLNHPNVVQIFDLGEAEGAYFIAMEYIHGEDARRIWRQSELVGNPIPVPLVCRIVMDAAAGLDYAHKRTDASGAPLNIIHRDVSPQNLLVSFEGAVKVADFGIAKAADQATQTRSGVLKGKYSYMSPEQASGKEIDHRTDQFALGIVFYELLTLRRLFKRSNDIQTLTAVSECKVAPPSEVNPRIPQGLDAIVMKALARNPDDRYRDLSEMQMAIEEWLLVNQQPSSPSHLSAFLKAIYADRLAREQEVGTPIFQDPSETSSSISAQAPRRRTGLSAIGQPALGEQTRAARRGPRAGGSLVGKPAAYRAPPVPGYEDDDEPTPVEPEPITGSSVSRLVDRMSGRKKAALGALGVALVAAAAGIFLLQPQGRTVTTRPGGETPQPIAEVPKPATPKYAGLKIVTTPAGASVVVDGKRQEELTPLTVAGLELGVHQIFIEHKGYLDEQRAVTLEEEGTIVPLNLELKPDPSQRMVRLVIDTEPPGAEVILDGERIGHSPTTKMIAANRRAQIEVIRDGYRRLSEDVAVGPGPEKKLFFTLAESQRHSTPRQASGPATISLDCDPPASIWEGKSFLGQTPFRGTLPPGRHRLTLVNRDLGFEMTVPLVLKPGENITRSYRLDQGEVLIVATPWADVYLRGKKLGTTPMPKLTLYEGEHQLTLVNTDLGTKKSVVVMVKPGRLEKMTVDMAGE
ncbi:MAG: protein kinase domain-containing protein [Myxococcales bacterium]